MTASEAIREARRLAGITQEELADRLGLKRACVISNWEHGRRNAKTATLFRVLGACGMNGFYAADGWTVQRKKRPA